MVRNFKNIDFQFKNIVWNPKRKKGVLSEFYSYNFFIRVLSFPLEEQFLHLGHEIFTLRA